MVVAIHFGLTITLAGAAAAYLLAAVFSRAWRHANAFAEVYHGGTETRRDSYF
jgi:hypothetical protein